MVVSDGHSSGHDGNLILGPKLSLNSTNWSISTPPQSTPFLQRLGRGLWTLLPSHFSLRCFRLQFVDPISEVPWTNFAHFKVSQQTCSPIVPSSMQFASLRLLVQTFFQPLPVQVGKVFPFACNHDNPKCYVENPKAGRVEHGSFFAGLYVAPWSSEESTHFDRGS